MNKAARNERRKITATAINNIAVAFVVRGFVVPAVCIAYQFSYPQTRFWWLFALLWLASRGVVHLASRRVLARIEE